MILMLVSKLCPLFIVIMETEILFSMKKIDILNFITDFRKTPNAIKGLSEIRAHLGTGDETALLRLLEEMKQMRTLREVEKDGEKAFQVAAK